MADKLNYRELELPNYRNTRPAFANLDVSDLVRAAVLGQLNVLLVGETGCGKTQLAKDIYNVYFGGNKKDGGQGIFIRAHPDVDIYNEVFSELNIQKASRDLTKGIEAKMFLVDEINRAPAVAQNQFFGMGDGIMDYKGHSIQLGNNGQRIMVATANLGNGEYHGTFETDRALYNRLHFAIDFDYQNFKPTDADKIAIRRAKLVNPNVKESAPRDISEKVRDATGEIDGIIAATGLEAQAVLNYLALSLDSCQRNGCKEKTNWSVPCQDCKYNKKEDALCSMIREPTERTVEATQRYGAALHYLAKLKDSNVALDNVDLLFKAFELTGAFQHILNPQVLQRVYGSNNPKFMAEATRALKEDFRKSQDYICTSLERAKEGEAVTRFFEHNKTIGNYDLLSQKAKAKLNPIEPYTKDREIRLDWMNDFIKVLADEARVSKAKK